MQAPYLKHPLNAAAFDCIIVGGGLVGTTFALALRTTNIKTALIEAKTPTKNDPRLLALNASSCQFLKYLGVWERVAEYATPIHDVHISYKGHFGAVRLSREMLKASTLGSVIPAYELESALYELLSESDINFYQATVAEVAAGDEKVTVVAQANDERLQLNTKLLIAADGTHSTIRKLLNYSTITKDYQQTAIVSRIQLQGSHHHTAYERFLSEGALAMLPLASNECAAILTINQIDADKMLSLTDQEFLASLQEKFGTRLGRFKCVGPRYSYPLKMVHTDNTQKEQKDNIILLGNAAHTLSPIAAQGFNLALYEVATVASYMMKEGSDINLANLQIKFQHQQVFSKKLSDQLSQVFASPSLIKSMLIPLGMTTFDLLPTLKKKFLDKIMGRGVMFPELLVGATK